MRGAVHHIDLTVGDLDRSDAFYGKVLAFLGYRRVRGDSTGIDWDLRISGNLVCSIGLKPARSDRVHDRYSAGLHHLAWHAASREEVDRLHELLLGTGAHILDAPAEYPDYGAGYYALFFADPDGLKLEFVHWPASG
jgi:catechol 2,3-dioxygenase-like lactoylglutathione lyase family enzyme